MINKCFMMGRLTSDPEMKRTNNDLGVTSFSIAVNRNYKDAKGEYPADFLNIVAWRKNAEFICKHFSKGDLIAIVGSLQSRKWEDKNGNARTAYEINVDEVSFCGNKKNDDATDKADAEVSTEDEEDMPY